MLAGEMAAWSAGAASTAIRERDGDGDSDGDKENGNGVEKLEGRPAPVTDRTGEVILIGFADRSWATAVEGHARRTQSINETERTLFF
jgi:hypothetical protein